MDFSKLDEVCLKWEGSYRSALLEMGHWVGWGTIENFARNQQSVHPTVCQCGEDCIPMLGEDTCVRCNLPLAHIG